MAKNMLVPDQKRGSEGFTIIELMIVLGIGGLILAITFLAIPSLNRNGHNNQRKQDVAAVLGVVSQYGLNNSGEFPQASITSVATKAKLSYYTATDVTADTVPPATNPTGISSSNDKIKLYNHAKCDTANIGQATTQGAGYSDIVALFSIETSGGSSPQCQEL